MSHPFPIPAVYLCLDFETTARIPTQAGIVELAIARVELGAVLNRWLTLANPGRPCEDGATAAHGITQAEIDAAPPVAELLPELVLGWLSDGLPVVAYNGPRYDAIVLKQAALAVGIELPDLTWIDPWPLARKLLPGLPSYTLGAVAEALGVTGTGRAHRADADVELLICVVEALRLRAAGQGGWDAPPPAPPVKVKASFCPHCAVTDTIPPERHGPACPLRLELVRRLAAGRHGVLGGHPAGAPEWQAPAVEPAPFLAPPSTATAIETAPPADASPLVADALVALSPLGRRVAAWVKAADALACDNDDDERRVVDALATFRNLERDAVKARGKYTDEIGRQKRAIESAWREQVIRPIEAVSARLEDKRKPLALARAKAAHAERLRLANEAEAIAEGERQRLLLEQVAPAQAAALEAAIAGDARAEGAAHAAAAQGLDDANDLADRVHTATIEQAAAIKPAPVVGEKATAHDRIVWRVRVTLPRMVPAIYCSPDEAKILAAIEAADGQIQIPGVEFEADVATTTRARRG